MEALCLAVPTLFGLEGICAEELKRMGAQDVRAENGRVLCEYDPALLVRANLCLRTGERVLLRLGRFEASAFDALFEGVKALPWEQFIPKDGAFPVQAGHSLNSALQSIPACQRIIKKAAATRLGEVYHIQTLPEMEGLYQIRFSIMKDTAELFLDTTGPSLHKRGYRAEGVAAPLRETLAAGMVLLSHYRGKDPFRDPFCGSGTIPIEAALIAKNRAPGLSRSFAAQRWKSLDKRLWSQEVDRAKDLEYHGDYDILGSDIDPKAVSLAKANARKAGVADTLRFEEADATQFAPSEPSGKVVTNPPYGERLSDRREAEKLYAAFGRTWRQMPPGWSLYLLSSHTEFERTFGRTADKKRKLYNGMLKCDLFQYFDKKGARG